MSPTPRHAFLPILGHEVHVTEWGDPDNPPVVLWHGLARTGRDFDELAASLADTHFVLCPDTIGRGLSGWSQTPESEYSIAHYAELAIGLLDHYQIAKTGWLGTSMGGLIGMRIASGPLAERLTYLIINDIGPEIPQDAIDRILAYAGDLPTFDTVAEAETWLRSVYAPFGAACDTFWQRLAQTSVRRQGDGRLTLHYDPKIVVQFSASADELTVWDRYEKIVTPTHVLCGENSDILTPGILERMCAAGPKPTATVFEKCGHAPSLSRVSDIREIHSVISSLQQVR